jgi:hypothetical protein
VRMNFFFTLCICICLISCKDGRTPFYSSDTFEFSPMEVNRAVIVINSVAALNKLVPFYEDHALVDPSSDLGRSFHVQLIYDENQVPVVSISSFPNIFQIRMVTSINGGLNERELDTLIDKFKVEFELNGWTLNQP